jgi:hypothetical protein
MDKHNFQIMLAAIFGVVFLVVILVVAIMIPNPTKFEYVVFRITIALAAGGVAAMIPGILNVNIPHVLTAGGALAAFIIVYFYSPAGLAVRHVPAEDNYVAPRSVLQKQREDAARFFEESTTSYLTGFGELSAVIGASDRLLDADLALSTESKEKVLAHQAALKRAKDLEISAEKKLVEGTGLAKDVTEAKLHLIKIEIGLAKEQSKP